MAMEWKLIDLVFNSNKHYFVGNNLYTEKAHYFRGSWCRYADGAILDFVPTHYAEIEPRPEIVKLKLGDYIREISTKRVCLMNEHHSLAWFASKIQEGTYEIVSVHTKSPYDEE